MTDHLVSIPLGSYRQRQHSTVAKSQDLMTSLKTKKNLFLKCAAAATLCILFLWLLYSPNTVYQQPSSIKKGWFLYFGAFKENLNLVTNVVDVSSLDQIGANQTCSATKDGQPATEYAVMIDAGSSGSRVHVYRFKVCHDPVLEDEVFHMLSPGLSSFKEDAQGAAQSLSKLMEIAVKSVPKESQSCTPIAVKATAGLRMLPGQQSKNILGAVRKYLETYPFPIANIEIMEGKDEGMLYMFCKYLRNFCKQSIFN